MTARIAVALLALAVAACADPPPRLANPASENCLRLGGGLAMERRPAGEYGVCHFGDNRQCEEWALLRGHCPPGGLRVTGYLTEAARYCALVGGRYRTSGPGGAGTPEEGTCALPDGRHCDADALFDGTCPPAAGRN